MANNLTTSVSEEANTTTENPQSVGAASSINGGSKNLQNNTSQASINESGLTGIPLGTANPKIVDINKSVNTTKTVATVVVLPKKHHINPVAGGIVLLLIVIAVVVAMGINKSSKITTDY